MMDLSQLWTAESDEPSVDEHGVYIRTTSQAINVQPGEVTDIDDDGKIHFKRNSRAKNAPDRIETYDWITNPASIPYQRESGILAPYSMYEDHENIHKDDIDLTFRSLRFGNEALVPTESGFATCSHDNLMEVQSSRARALTAYNVGGNLGEDRVVVCTDCQTIQF